MLSWTTHVAPKSRQHQRTFGAREGITIRGRIPCSRRAISSSDSLFWIGPCFTTSALISLFVPLLAGIYGAMHPADRGHSFTGACGQPAMRPASIYRAPLIARGRAGAPPYRLPSKPAPASRVPACGSSAPVARPPPCLVRDVGRAQLVTRTLFQRLQPSRRPFGISCAETYDTCTTQSLAFIDLEPFVGALSPTLLCLTLTAPLICPPSPTPDPLTSQVTRTHLRSRFPSRQPVSQPRSSSSGPSLISAPFALIVVSLLAPPARR